MQLYIWDRGVGELLRNFAIFEVPSYILGTDEDERRGFSVLPLGTGLPPENFEKSRRSTLVWVYSEALEIGPLQVYSLGFFSVLDPAGLLLGCQLPTLDPNYWSQVGFKSFNVYPYTTLRPRDNVPMQVQCWTTVNNAGTTLSQHWIIAITQNKQ